MLCVELTAYAIRSPLGSDERGVACPRVVVGEAAQMASVSVSVRPLSELQTSYRIQETCCKQMSGADKAEGEVN